MDGDTVRPLRAWRLAHPYSIRDLAAAADVSPMTVQRIERGHPARPATMRALSAALAVRPSQIAEFRPLLRSAPVAVQEDPR